MTRKIIILNLFLFFSIIAFPQTVKYIGISPSPEDNVSSIQDITVYFDLSEFYEKYPEIDKNEWQLKAAWGRDQYSAKLYEGSSASGTPAQTYQKTITGEKGAAEFSFSFPSATTLTPGKTYTLWMSQRVSLCYNGKSYSEGAMAEDIVITFTGGQQSSLAATLSPTTEETLDTIPVFSVTFDKEIAVTDSADAYIYEGNEIYATASNISVDASNAAIAHVSFDKVPLFNSHTYSFVMAKGSVVATDGSLVNDNLTFSGYKGHAKKTTCSFGSATPADGSEIKYLKDVEIKINTPSGYNVGTTTKGSAQLFKGENELIGDYSVEANSSANGIVVHIKNYQLDANSTYRLIVPERVVVPRLASYSTPVGDLLDTTNPEIILTYTTPVNLPPIPRTEGLIVSASTDNKICVLVPSFTFEGTTTFVRPNSGNSSVEDIEDEVEEKTRTFVTVPIYEVVNGEDVDKGTVKLEYNPAPDGAGDNVTGLEGTPDFSLYEGHTYKIVIPEGALFPYTYEGEYKNSAFWNLETPLTFEGAKAINGLAVTGSSLKAGEALPSVGVVAFYTNEDATATDGAKIQIVKEGETTTAKEAALFIKGTSVLADFTDDAHAPFATDSSAVYSLVLPEGSLIGPDGILTNAADTVKFTGIIPTVIPETEYVSATLSLDGYASGTTKVVKDETATFTITPADGWKLATLTLNDADVLSDYAEGSYTTPALAADATVAATFEFEGYTYECSEATGIVNAEGTGYSIKVDGQTITLSGLNSGDAVSVYTLGGALIDKQTTEYGTAKIGVPAGTYIVKVGQTAFKTIVK